MKNLAIPVAGSAASLSRLVALVKSKILNHPVDRLATIQAQIAALRDRAKLIEDKLRLEGEGVYEGVLFRASVSRVERNTTAWKEVAEHFAPSRQLIAAHTNNSSFLSVRLGAKLKGA